MADTFGNKFATITLRLKEHTEEVKRRVQQRVKVAAEALRTQIVRNISVSTRASGPSAPGEFPHADTGRLRNSIFWGMRDELTAEIGSNLNYAVFLEYGVEGEKTVVAGPGKVFAWRDPVTGEMIFRKKITLKGMAARPFLRATLVQMMPELKRILTQGGQAEVSGETSGGI